MRQCEVISRLFGATAPIRVDVRQFREEIDLALIDIKMKRSYDRSWTARTGGSGQHDCHAAAAMGWDYGMLLQHVLEGAKPLVQFLDHYCPFSIGPLAIK